LCGLLIVATLIAAIMSLGPGHDEADEAWRSHRLFHGHSSRRDSGRPFLSGWGTHVQESNASHTSLAHQTALRFSTRLPLVGVMWWIGGIVFMVGFGA